VSRKNTIHHFLIYWYYFWGVAVSKIMGYGILGHLYPLYNRWMIKSSEYDINNELWEKPEKIKDITLDNRLKTRE